MKHAIPVKFIAVLLCAASLLAAVAGGLSIVILAESGLYDKNANELYAEQMEDQAYWFAEGLAQSYASTNLGQCPEEMLGHYSYFSDGYYGYTLKDAEGNVLDSLELADTTGSISFDFTVNGSYMKVLNTYGSSTGSTTVSTSDYQVFDAIAEESTLIFSFNFDYEGDTVYTENENPIGYIQHNEEGRACFISFEPYIVDMPDTIDPTRIAFLGEGNEMIYEISNSGSVGQLFYDETGLVCFTSATATALNVPADTEPTVATEDAYPMTEPVEVPAVANVKYFSYYDEALGHEVTVEYEWAVMPEYTVTVTLLPGASYDSYYYTLLGVLRAYRHNFPWLLGFGLLIFAISLVYLCCAAGRKPGSDEVRPTALNRLPLDLYLGVGALAVTGLAVACVEGGQSLFRENVQVGLGFMAATAFGISLICVGFVFAFSAQVKSKNRYWLRNTICGRFLILIVRFLRWTDRGAHKVWPAFCGGVKRGWGWFVRFIVNAYKFIETALIKICLFLGRTAKAIWKYGVIFIVKAYHLIKTALVKFFSWLGRHIARFFALLPLTWQWLLMGFLLMFLIFLAVQANSGGMLIFFVCASFAVILYGAHCFGILLESAKKMRKGDLEAKVDDKLLIGSFKDFSTELNGLASVTTVAVQKQLKSERMKAELVTNVSHDIKTPLTSIINYVDLMKRPHSDEEHELYLEVLDRQSQRLKKLIEDLMEMSKASTGNMNVDLIQLNAAEAVNQALGEFSDKFHTVNLTPVFHHPEEPVTMLADGRLVWRVLSNLFSNAYKYALPGTRLYIDLIGLDDSAVITIKNISKEQLNVDAAELMERFVRGDTSRNTEGSGLGLNIAKSLVELQSGRMELMVDGDLFKVTLVFPLA